MKRRERLDESPVKQRIRKRDTTTRIKRQAPLKDNSGWGRERGRQVREVLG